MKTFFVMLYTQKPGIYCPMQDPEGRMYFFASKIEALRAAEDCFYAQEFGFEVFDMEEPLPL
jgi:hypothetical protein